MQEPMTQYVFNMITSWAIVCDVWYLPPMTIQVIHLLSRLDIPVEMVSSSKNRGSQ